MSAVTARGSTTARRGTTWGGGALIQLGSATTEAPTRGRCRSRGRPTGTRGATLPWVALSAFAFRGRCGPPSPTTPLRPPPPRALRFFAKMLRCAARKVVTPRTSILASAHRSLAAKVVVCGDESAFEAAKNNPNGSVICEEFFYSRTQGAPFLLPTLMRTNSPPRIASRRFHGDMVRSL